ncbi:MAG: calcium-binding protein [Oscillospiraceae bacterium]|nr:calcium-binding protein [Oscillospiraceae bacterium]
MNPNYNNDQKYIPRTERPEWDAVGLLGKLVAVDDGSCQMNGWCKVGEGGIAVHSEQCTPYRVMTRLDETHIRVLILPSC